MARCMTSTKLRALREDSAVGSVEHRGSHDARIGQDSPRAQIHLLGEILPG